MRDRNLGWTLSVLFAVGGLVLLLVPWVTPGIINPSVFTFSGAIFGFVLSALFALSVLIKHRYNCSDPSEENPETCTTHTS